MSKEDTRAVHGRAPRAHAHDSITAPVVQTATYAFRDTAELYAYFEGKVVREEYGRYGNPTVRVFEEQMAALEGAESGVGFASGMGALTTAILAFVKSGSHVVLFDDCYRRTRQFVQGTLARFGVTSSLVPAGDVGALAAAITSETRLVIAELPTNPYLFVLDLPAVVAVCRERNVRTLIDATFATPINLRAIEHGADIVVHSATKYLAGHNDVLAGVVVGAEATMSLVRDLRGVLGAMLDPHAAYLAIRGVKTLGLRVERQNATALSLARALEGHPRVERVWYPMLASHPTHANAAKLLRGGGGVVTFAVRADLRGTSQVIDALRIPRIAPSLGGVESLVEQPALMSFFELDSEARAAIGVRDNAVRYSVGLEDPDEIVADVLRALA